mmetsp:Transcript_15842/g.39351  ORF Transcript_15842/g.39351 Transcript_15842/m.39351 type:complete len:617 (+) Transcript_15842:846-2696(+)
MRDVPARHRSGLEIRVTIGLCFLELGGERQYVAFVRDLTEQKRQDELQQATFQASIDPIVVTDEFGIIQTANQAMLDKFLYEDPSDIVGKSISILVPERYTTAGATYGGVAEASNSIGIGTGPKRMVGLKDREMIAIRSDGTEFPIKLGFQKIKADHIHDLHLVEFIRDITDEKQALRVTQMMGEIKGQQAKVEMERDMTAYFAHELRNPLGAIDSALQTMPDDLQQPTSAQGEAKELYQSIRQCTTYMSQIMGDLLDIRRWEEGQMTLQQSPLDLEQLLKDVRKKLLPSVRTGVDLRCNTNLAGRNWVIGDLARLRQVLNNVATNAIKYTTSGSITLSLQWWSEDNDNDDDDNNNVCQHKRVQQVRFECKDTGINIPQEDHVNLFKRFVKRGGAPGTGLGLAVAKHIVDYMGGSIWFADVSMEAPAGSTCIALLPLKVTTDVPTTIIKTEKKKEATPIPTPTPATTKKDNNTTISPVVIEEKLEILVTDDIDMNRKMAKRRFRKVAPNCSITEACTGEEALDMCRRDPQKFDVIIMDNYMEKSGGAILGTDVVAEMRKSIGVQSLIIGCSGNDLDKEFVAAGAEFFWGKPMPSNTEIVRQIKAGINKNESTLRAT